MEIDHNDMQQRGSLSARHGSPAPRWLLFSLLALVTGVGLTSVPGRAQSNRGGGELRVERLSPTTPGHCANPLLAPDGRTVAYERVDEANRGRQVLLLPLGGVESPVLPVVGSGGSLLARFNQANFPILRDFAWTPAGPFIKPHPYVVAASREDYGAALFLAGLGRLTDGNAIEGSPSWSPDGRRLIYTSSQTGEGDLYQLDLTTTPRKLQRLTSTEHEAELFPTHAPRNEVLCFVRHSETGDRLVLLEAPGKAGQKERVLSLGPGSHTRPSWSPDGKRLAYFSSPAGSAQFDLYVLDLKAPDSPRRLLSGVLPPDRHGAVWTPDGSGLIAVQSQTQQADPLVRVSVETGQVQVLPTHTLHNRDPNLGLREGRPYLVFSAQGTREDLSERSWWRIYGTFLSP